MKITGSAIKLGIVSLVLLLITVSIVVVFAQLRFNRTNSYTAEFSNASGLKDGQFEPREDDDSSRSWLAKATLGLIDSNTAPPQMETQASKDVMRQYEDARQQIPRELQPEHQDEEVEKPDTSGKKSHSWWHYLTFGLVD